LFFHSDVYLSAPLTEIVGCDVQVSQVYQTMKISNLTNMIAFFDFSVVEKIAVDAVKYNVVQVKIDHLKGIVGFGSQ
jgi:translation initiation factor 3 subunit A